MKMFITLKVGYSTGIYGCSAEYFTTIIIDGEKTSSISHYGMYGSEDRVNEVLKKAGFIDKYIPSDFGKIGRREAWRGFKSEYEAVNELKALYNIQ